MKATLMYVITIMVLATGFLSTSAEAAGVCGSQRNCWISGGCWDSHQGHYASEKYCGGYNGGYNGGYSVPSRPYYNDDYYGGSSSSNCYGTLLTVPSYGRNPWESERYINCSVENCRGKVLRTPNSRRLISCY